VRNINWRRKAKELTLEPKTGDRTMEKKYLHQGRSLMLAGRDLMCGANCGVGVGAGITGS
jgi:hypothetical protein